MLPIFIFPADKILESLSFKSMHESGNVGRADVAADDAVAVDDDVCVHSPRVSLIVGHREGVACCILVLVLYIGWFF